MMISVGLKGLLFRFHHLFLPAPGVACSNQSSSLKEVCKSNCRFMFLAFRHITEASRYQYHMQTEQVHLYTAILPEKDMTILKNGLCSSKTLPEHHADVGMISGPTRNRIC